METLTASESTTAATRNEAAAATAADHEKILNQKAKSYQDAVHVSTWRARSRGVWAGTFLGIFFGGTFGAIAALSTVFVGVPLAAAGALMLPAAAAFAVAGIISGVALCADVGANSGSVAGGLKEQDRRALANGDPSIAPDTAKRESWAEQFNLIRGSKGVFNWKVLFAGAAVGLAIGSLFVFTGGLGVLAGLKGLGVFASIAKIGAATAAAGSSAAAATAAGEALVASAATAMTLTTSTLFGAFFGMDMPTISKNTSNLMGGFLSGDIFDPKKYGPGPGQEQAQAATPAIARSKQVTESLAFKGDTVKTMVTPMGSYAGKEAGQHLRSVAERQFKEMGTAGATRH